MVSEELSKHRFSDGSEVHPVVRREITQTLYRTELGSGVSAAVVRREKLRAKALAKSEARGRAQSQPSRSASAGVGVGSGLPGRSGRHLGLSLVAAACMSVLAGVPMPKLHRHQKR